MQIDKKSQDTFVSGLTFKSSNDPSTLVIICLIPVFGTLFILFAPEVAGRIAAISDFSLLNIFHVLISSLSRIIAASLGFIVTIVLVSMLIHKMRPDQRAIEKLRHDIAVRPLVTVREISENGIEASNDASDLGSGLLDRSDIETVKKILNRRTIPWTEVMNIEEILGPLYRGIPFHALTLKTEFGPARLVVWGGQAHRHSQGIILSPVLYAHWNVHKRSDPQIIA